VYEAQPQISEEGGQSVILQEPSPNGNLEETMTANNKIDAIGWLRKQLEQAPDPLREALAEVIMAVMNAEADAMCVPAGDCAASRCVPSWGPSSESVAQLFVHRRT